MNFENIKNNVSNSLLALENNVDIQICNTNFQFTEKWLKKFNETNATENDIFNVADKYNNVVESVRVLIQVHKPPRVLQQEIHQEILKKIDNE